MFGGSEEFILREIFDHVQHIWDLHFDLSKNFLELQYANDLKEYELGIIDQNEFIERKNGHYEAIEELYEQKRNR